MVKTDYTVTTTKPERLAYSVKEAAELTGLSVITIRRACYALELPSLKNPKKQYSKRLIMVKDLEAWLLSMRICAKKSP